MGKGREEKGRMKVEKEEKEKKEEKEEEKKNG